MPILGIMASQISGHLWSPEGAYDALATVTLSATTASITFAGIPTSYKHLQIRGIARTNTGTSLQDVRIRFNSDSASNYSSHKLYGDGTGAYAAGNASQTSGFSGLAVDGGVGASFISASIIDILDYTSTTKVKTVRVLSGNDSNTSTSVGYLQYGSSAWYKNTSSVYESINNIDLILTANSFAQYSSFALYGVK